MADAKILSPKILLHIAGPISVLGIDPGLRTGCKIAVVDETGKFLAHDVLYLHTSKKCSVRSRRHPRRPDRQTQRPRHRDRQRNRLP
jgi:transcriptional accessory protein Tex/SPT6